MSSPFTANRNAHRAYRARIAREEFFSVTLPSLVCIAACLIALVVPFLAALSLYHQDHTLARDAYASHLASLPLCDLVHFDITRECRAH